MLPHVSDCDGLAVMVELLPECQIKSIISARDIAIKENISLLKWAKDLRLRSFRDTYYRDYYATHKQARGLG